MQGFHDDLQSLKQYAMANRKAAVHTDQTLTSPASYPLAPEKCAFSTPAGEQVASITPVSWSFTDTTGTAVSLCADFTGKKGPVFPIGVPVLTCITVPVGTYAPVNLGGETYGKVTLHR